MNAGICAIAVGRLVSVKNFDLLLESWQTTSIPLAIVGDGPLRQSLERQAMRLNVQDRISFLGHRDDVLDLMAKATLFVQSSQREGFGYVALEALQARCIVISTPVGVAAELVPERYLIDHSVAALSGAVQYVSEHLDEVVQEFEAVWDRARQLTVSQMVDSLASVYQLVLKEHEARL